MGVFALISILVFLDFNENKPEKAVLFLKRAFQSLFSWILTNLLCLFRAEGEVFISILVFLDFNTFAFFDDFNVYKDFNPCFLGF